MYIFAADIHLRPGNSADEERFSAWLTSLRDARRIYLLGDLFEYWYSGLENRIQHIMKLLCDPRIAILPGNRDFLLTNLHMEGISIVRPEELRVRIMDKTVLLAHGHTLPRADYGFKFLHRCGWPLIRLADRLIPPQTKDRLATHMVKTSAAIRPLDAVIPEDTAARKDVDLVICGHLHRKVCTDSLLVLPPFQDGGEYMVWDEGGMTFRSVSRSA